MKKHPVSCTNNACVTVKAQRLVNPRFYRYILACAVMRWWMSKKGLWTLPFHAFTKQFQ